MSLRFIYGRAGSGKTRFCLEEIKSRITSKATHPLVLLVPEQFTFQAERDLISVLGTGGILKTEVLSFSRIAYRTFNEAGGITYPHIHSAGKCMILYRILDKMKGSFRVFSKTADRQGFVNTLSTLITEFKKYNVTPEDLEKVSKELEEDNPVKEKLMELTAIYDLFEKTIAERYRDPDDDLTLAAKKLGSIPLYDGAEIWIDGFTGFTPQEYQIIGQLMKKAQRVNISFCTDCLDGDLNDTDIFSSIKTAYRKLVKMAKENGIPVEPSVVLNSKPLFRFSQSPELSHLEQYLYAYPYKTYNEKTKDISLFSSVNIFAEVEACARDIVRLCRDRGMRYREIAVVTGNLDGYEKLIEAVFSEYGIPCFIDRKVDIVNHPLVRLIMSMLDIFIENWSYEAVFRYLKTGLTGIDRESIDRLENYVLACGIRGSCWTETEEWKMVPELIPNEKSLEEAKELLEDVNRIRAQVVAPLMEFRKKTKGRKKASDFCASLYDFLCTLGIPEKIEDAIEKFRESGNLNLANEYSQVWNAVMEVFDHTVEVMGDETFGIEKFARILEIGFGECKIGLIPASLDQVLVGSLERSRSHEIKALYILGANDGVFPPAVMEEGILSDQDRAVLNNAGIELASDTRTQAFDGQYLIYRALTTAGNYLRISWSIADHEGRTLRPSLVVFRLRKLFLNITETSNILPSGSLEEEMELLSGNSPAFKSMVSALRQKADGKEIKPVWQEAYRWFAVQDEWRGKCEALRAAFQYKNLAQPVSREKIAALYGEPAVSSVSRLEKYTACPFAFYVQYGLGAKERQIYSLRPPDVGTFMHAVIEKFSRMVAKRNISWRDLDRDWCSEKVSEIVDEMLEKMQGSGIAASRRYTALTLRLKRVVARAVWLIAEHIRRSSFEPVAYEVGFGENGKYPPIVIELDSGEKIHLTGRIDRVDALKTEDGTYLRIVDYKSGGKDFKLSDVFYGLQIQLITYLDALWESGEADENNPVLPGGVLYFKIDDPIIRGNGRMTEEEIEKAIMKQLRMKGLLLADVKLIREMDKDIEGSSMIIPATVNKDGSLGKNTSAATMEQFKLLRKYVRKLLKNLCEEIMKGNVSINPYKKKGTTSCKYCSFLPVCQFDTTMKENTFKLLYDKKDDEIWSLMAQEEEE
ncbi:MAG TPA: ATP-dependent helicase/deoxyribonuclease subunit B [Hungateiclostridium thermocellum]|uniref:ATP-dependent helicase/deoxyribonuclease subunit B n=1 Tax=Acetivibrio thermocellus (strain ATCC 27405 / DSM 1237 / JCM 9322 / NBRC 103400 / NCIMB 10682 / NRRL B-4536 / VPI 7372) TaxID=203119 RepID=ADDB_ACET2|nr:helicase-exonuclease AddAB subunit AddB [Acetivibrio thermocellus]A3DH20.1 RecName: Full=ATP-dependent helicase/deoxyribonuclease subunit B; AltName: Full=ATP-dependent helicase/nuclease AddB; AltName: Full=DNA 3'-5' helicase AddB [Acetivibrio thermocellus ATCC 27405]ABN53249.1 ATP-dependent nuclease subunit B [Acetivibrio thermocellus ATCC 27405]NLU27595.1 helicase-exonuclease AddAB subunit AddB [Acetivibrio thermocellus]HBW27383.1 ATP-dependent helicase/deoxyribonuclease subunit B [Acetivi